MISAALVATLVGYSSSVALILTAATALGASAAQTASWLLALCLAKALGSVVLSTWTRVPVVLAWSTPGAALLASTQGISMPQAVAAFILAGLLIAATGIFRPLGRMIGAIPDGIAAAMLAGVLLPFCLKGSAAAQTAPQLVLPMVAIFLCMRLWNPGLAVLAALAAGLALAFGGGTALLPDLTLPTPSLTFIPPEWQTSVLLGLGLPLYLVTMASQNLPGFAVLRAMGYEPPVNRALGVTGVISAVSAIFGAHAVNMAAITAAICLNEEVHPDRNQRWKVALAYGGIWMVLGLLSPVILLLLAALPAQVMMALVALALLGPLMGALAGAYTPVSTRFAATITLAVTASGVTALGMGAAMWGLVAGLLVYLLDHTKARLQQKAKT